MSAKPANRQPFVGARAEEKLVLIMPSRRKVLGEAPKPFVGARRERTGSFFRAVERSWTKSKTANGQCTEGYVASFAMVLPSVTNAYGFNNIFRHICLKNKTKTFVEPEFC